MIKILALTSVRFMNTGTHKHMDGRTQTHGQTHTNAESLTKPEAHHVRLAGRPARDSCNLPICASQCWRYRHVQACLAVTWVPGIHTQVIITLIEHALLLTELHPTPNSPAHS